MDEQARCLDCGGALDRGRMMVALEGSIFPVLWVEGDEAPPLHGKKRGATVEVARCAQCGALRLYAPGD